VAAKAEIPVFESGVDLSLVKGALDESGCAVIRNVQAPELTQEVKAELGDSLGKSRVQEDDSAEDFYPAKTQRLPALLARSKGAQRMATHPTIQSLCEHHLGNNCERFQLHVSAAVNIGPGAREQVLHREEDAFPFFEIPRPNLVIATMWAMSDFTHSNGATLLVPGSHRWQTGRQATPDEVAQADMPEGSVMIWLGGTLHAAGGNSSNEWRYGIILSYSLGWLRQEENQYLSLPPALAKNVSDEVRELVGYPMHGSLGFYDPRIAKI
tara:strand:+ start:170 stop:973 length:804 start_codon:yes stop_codon:yes gene_type:complete